MFAHRKLRILFLGFMFVLSTLLAHAQETKTRDVMFGVLGINGNEVYLVNLTERDPKSNSPYMYLLFCDDCKPLLKQERTYKGTIKQSVSPMGAITSIMINGTEHKADSFGLLCTDDFPGGGHWEWTTDGKPVCKLGEKETIKWKGYKGSIQPDKEAKKNKNVPPCDDQPGFSNITLTVVTTVKPAANMEWKFPEAPSVVAARILQGLSANTRNITFKEASGVTPNLYLTVTLSETNEGTRRDTAYAEVTGLGKTGILFSESRGQDPFTDWRDAADKLSVNMLTWFQNGWRSKSRCLQSDGSVRSH